MTKVATATSSRAFPSQAGASGPDIELPVFSGAHPGDVIGGYRLREILGRGGMGTVFRAEALPGAAVPAGSMVALKLLRGGSDDERRRSRREAGYLQALRHPGIVRVLDQGESGTQPWLAMEVVEGDRLDTLAAREAPIDPRRAATLLVQALEALHCAHLAGILHRDVKPANLLVRGDGSVVLVDFGLARRVGHETRLTRSGAVVGTPAYMSPEQAAGEDSAMSVLSDVYSMGAVLAELLTGSPPYEAPNPAALLRTVIEEPFPSPRQARRDLPLAIDTIVLRACSKHPSDRYPSAEEFAADLRRFLAGKRVRATRPGWLRPGVRACWRHRRTIAIGGLIAFVLSAGILLSVRQVVRLRTQLAAKDTELAAKVAESTEDWIRIYACPGAFTDKGPARRPIQALGLDPEVDAELITLASVKGAVRASVVAVPSASPFRVELMILDRDFQQGYALRLEQDVTGTRAVLLRRNRTVQTIPLPAVDGSGIPMQLSRVEDQLHAMVGDVPLHFLDLTPLEGENQEGTLLLLTPGSVRVEDVTIERRRGSLLVSALLAADLMRQDGRYKRALDLYEAYYKTDHPDSPEATDAKLRSALCLDQLGDRLGALQRFHEIADSSTEDRYVLAATFHAWRLELKLNRMQDADRLFERLRSRYPLATLMSFIPEENVNDLLTYHLVRAVQLADSDPERAERLYLTAADLATSLGLSDRRAEAISGAGDMAVQANEIIVARSRYAQIAADSGTSASWLAKGILKQAEAERLAGEPIAAIELYRRAQAAVVPFGDETPGLARFWLADLLYELGRNEEAEKELQALKGGGGRAEAFARALLARLRPPDAVSDAWFANDCAFIEARGAWLNGDLDRWRSRLGDARALGGARDWPSSLARKLLIQDDGER